MSETSMTVPTVPAAANGRCHLRRLIMPMALVLLGSAGASYFKTDGWRVDVTGIKLPTENGQWLTADLFKPKVATEQNRVPLVVVCPGFERSKETIDSYSIELARRGMAVIAIDPYGQGASSTSLNRRTAIVEGYGAIPMLEFVTSTPILNYIDQSRIGAVGYSAGGNGVIQAAGHFGGRAAPTARKASVATAAASRRTATDSTAPHSPSKLAAVFVGGYVRNFSESLFAHVRSNVGVDYARYDESAFMNMNRDGDLRRAPEALRMVNSVLADRPVSEVGIGRRYGEVKNRTLRVVHNTPNIHPVLPYDPRSIAHVVDFFTDVFELKPSISALNQRWYGKELCTLLALFGALWFIVPLAGVLLQLPLFRPLAGAPPPPLPKPAGRGRVLFWSVFVGSALIACFSFIPLVNASTVLFPTANSGQPSWIFPARMNNGILLWAVFNGTIGLLLFWLTYRFQVRHHGTSPERLGLAISARDLARTAGLALVVFGAFYALLFTVYSAFHTDFRFLLVAAAASFPERMFIVLLEYVPLFFVFFLANSIRVNAGGRFAGRPEWASLLLMGVATVAGLVLIMAMHYSMLAVTGTVLWTEERLFVTILYGVIPMMFLLPFFNRWFFNLTGKVYLGPMVTCLIFVMMMLTNNVCYIPL